MQYREKIKMNQEIEIILEGLRRRHHVPVFVETSKDAIEKILGLIPEKAVVGIGDSTTVAQIGVKESLKKRGTTVLDGYDRGRSYTSARDYEEFHDKLVERSAMCDVFLTGTNAVTRDGRLVNVDAMGNRTAGMFWGHPKTIIVVGTNKIVRDLDEAFNRIRKVIAPNHVRIRASELNGRPVDTPCVITGECSDCSSKDRMCNVFTIIENKPLRTEITLIMVNEDLGLSWDPSWPKNRIAAIIDNYTRSVWVPPDQTKF